MKDYSNFFNAAYAINLEHRTDRLENITKSGIEAGLEVKRWNATKADDIDVAKHRIGKRVRKPSCIACWYSHVSLYRHAYEQNYDHVLVLEDDADIPPDLHEKLTELYNSYEFKDFDLIYLGSVDKYPSVKLTETIYLCQNTLMAHAIILSRKGLEKILSVIDTEDEGKCRMSVDVLLAEKIQPLNKSYRVDPPIVKFINGYSDIAHFRRSWKEAERTITHMGIKNPKKWNSYLNNDSKLF